MKTRFNWYFPISNEEVDSIWKDAVLTVDANVLLDLYRYHENTRNALIGSLKEFNGRLWLSSQAAEEFIRNRSKVIVSSEKTFNEAKYEVDKAKDGIESALAKLKKNRIIPTQIADDLFLAIMPAIENALKQIEDYKSSYPKYLRNDPILEDLAQMFQDSIGQGFSDEEQVELRREAEERKKNKTPPGYLDEDKDGDRQCGDFLLWRQILLHSKSKNTSLIFVTSERKEDWWEKVAGKTIGPRPELLREACEFGAQRILIYQTDRFLEFSSKRSGNNLDGRAVEEIRAIDSERSNLTNAVEVVEQQILEASEISQKGLLTINLHRPVRNLTASGNLEPCLEEIPEITASLESSPNEIGKYKIRAGAGTNHDFHLHVISAKHGALLPVGKYILKYVATCNSQGTGCTTVGNLSAVTGIPLERLLEQMHAAGIEVSDKKDTIQEHDKLTLLQYLRRAYNNV